MEDTEKQESTGTEIRSVIREALSEFIRSEQVRAEPAYKAELVEERKKRESLERTVRDLVEENRRSRQIAEELERSSLIRSELQRLGVTKVDLAYKAVRDEIKRAEDGRLVAATEQGEVSAKEYLSRFVSENPELLPARVSGGSGAIGAAKAPPAGDKSVDLDKIKPGMSPEERARVREEIARVAMQSARGL